MPSPLDEFDQVYRQFANGLGWHPRDVDRLEVWEAARLLGEPSEDRDTRMAIPARRLVKFESGPEGGATRKDGGGSTMGDDLQVQRIAAARAARTAST